VLDETVTAPDTGDRVPVRTGWRQATRPACQAMRAA
jgi:hypothetical protein